MKELVLNDGTYKYDDRTRQVSVSEDELIKLGYVKLADDEQVVKMVELTKEEADFVENHMSLPFYDLKEPLSYINSLHDYVNGKNVKYPRLLLANLAKAYFDGYTVKEEPKYYIKFPGWQTYEEVATYLNVDKGDGAWELDTKIQVSGLKTQFTQKEIDVMQQDERAKGLDLNTLKVKVPDGELED